jgi:hypothetical protein
MAETLERELEQRPGLVDDTAHHIGVAPFQFAKPTDPRRPTPTRCSLVDEVGAHA